MAELPEGPLDIAEESGVRSQLARLKEQVGSAADRDAAIDELRGLVLERPRLAEARVLLARGLVRVLEDDPDRRMQSETRINTVREAEISAHAALKYSPKDAASWATIGEIRELDGHLEAALEAYERALKLSTSDLRWSLAAARVAVDLGQERKAVRHLETLRARSRKLPAEVLLWEARSYLTLQATIRREGSSTAADKRTRSTYLARARRAFDELAEQTPEDSMVVAGQAYCRYEQLRAGDLERSDAAVAVIRDLYLGAARLAPSDPKPLFDLAVVLESDLVQDKTKDAAIEMYRSALERDPTHLPSQLNLARLLWQDEETKADATAIWKSVLPRLDGREKKVVSDLLEKGRL